MDNPKIKTIQARVIASHPGGMTIITIIPIPIEQRAIPYIFPLKNILTTHHISLLSIIYVNF